MVAISLVKTISHNLDKIMAHLELGNRDDARLYFRILFESICTFNYLMLKDDAELTYYQQYSRLVSYKDLILMTHYGLMSMDTLSDDGTTPLGLTLEQVKQELLETDVLSRVGRAESALEPANISNLADIKYAFVTINKLKDFLKSQPELGHAIDTAYFTMYNMGSQLIHTHWFSALENTFETNSTIFQPLFMIRTVAVNILWYALAVRNAGLITATEYHQVVERIVNVVNELRMAEGSPPMKPEDYEELVANNQLLHPLLKT